MVSRVWVVSVEVDREGGYVIGVTDSLDTAKALGSRWFREDQAPRSLHDQEMILRQSWAWVRTESGPSEASAINATWWLDGGGYTNVKVEGWDVTR